MGRYGRGIDCARDSHARTSYRRFCTVRAAGNARRLRPCLLRDLAADYRGATHPMTGTVLIEFFGLPSMTRSL
jgi:hypothetical protein